MKTKMILALAIAVTAALLTQSVSAQGASAVLTETSPTSLTATYTLGSTISLPVTNNGPDSWTVTFPITVDLGTGAWVEPENSSLGNVLTGTLGSLGFRNVLNVSSDVTTTLLLNADESTVPFGMDNGTVSVSVTFDDDAATAEAVSDTGSTVGLLSLSLIALFGARRVCSLRLA